LTLRLRIERAFAHRPEDRLFEAHFLIGTAFGFEALDAPLVLLAAPSTVPHVVPHFEADCRTQGRTAEDTTPHKSQDSLTTRGRRRTVADGRMVPDEGIEPPTFGLQNRSYPTTTPVNN
jgi:hypothetical protein